MKKLENKEFNRLNSIEFDLVEAIKDVFAEINLNKDEIKRLREEIKVLRNYLQ